MLRREVNPIEHYENISEPLSSSEGKGRLQAACESGAKSGLSSSTADAVSVRMSGHAAKCSRMSACFAARSRAPSASHIRSDQVPVNGCWSVYGEDESRCKTSYRRAVSGADRSVAA